MHRCWGSGRCPADDDDVFGNGTYGGTRQARRSAPLGSGLTGVLSRLYSSVMPRIRGTLAATARSGPAPVAEGVKSAAMRAGLNVVSDALRGKNVVKSAEQELKKAQESVLQGIGRRIGFRIGTAIGRRLKAVRRGGRRRTPTPAAAGAADTSFSSGERGKKRERSAAAADDTDSRAGGKRRRRHSRHR